jgi:hypothetical protein
MLSVDSACVQHYASGPCNCNSQRMTVYTPSCTSSVIGSTAFGIVDGAGGVNVGVIASASTSVLSFYAQDSSPHCACSCVMLVIIYSIYARGLDRNVAAGDGDSSFCKIISCFLDVASATVFTFTFILASRKPPLLLFGNENDNVLANS